MRYKSNPHQTSIDKDSIWVGMTPALYSGDYDQTQSKFFEIWLRGDEGNLSIDLGKAFATLLFSKPVTTNIGSKWESIIVWQAALINVLSLNGNNNLLLPCILWEEPAARIGAEIFKLVS